MTGEEGDVERGGKGTDQKSGAGRREKPAPGSPGMGYARNTIRKMLEDGAVPEYCQKRSRPSLVLGPYKAILDTWIS